MTLCIAQSAEAVGYTDCTSAEGLYPLNECLGYDTKQSDGEVPGMLALGNVKHPFISIIPQPTLVRNDNNW